MVLSYDKAEKAESLKICWGVVRQGQLKEKVLFLKVPKTRGDCPICPFVFAGPAKSRKTWIYDERHT